MEKQFRITYYYVDGTQDVFDFPIKDESDVGVVRLQKIERLFDQRGHVAFKDKLGNTVFINGRNVIKATGIIDGVDFELDKIAF